VNEISETD